ncbi:MAG: hypothetical protein ACP5FY_12610, partial [Kosmotogaceae bacterium]
FAYLCLPVSDRDFHVIFRHQSILYLQNDTFGGEVPISLETTGSGSRTLTIRDEASIIYSSLPACHLEWKKSFTGKSGVIFRISKVAI